ncbi:FlgB family protein [Rhodobacter capsulatus]|jgi:flagellar basal-body rod protein FlgB|uniref:Flagellar basal-body rod protein FlgB n=1 Tax=Rhodobacter capsulatus (strain ATCC BAA-309 / NBRC 16581 / SB1003) TaxID=272942 RepID=D5ATD3_RHOCB|nr:FlgB family protein [Rhodobacter capsulatus]ADE87244.1 flagellar basal-body rod protein; FlgB [Rhodobacter capsulatus SB 1003]ETD03468.1 flagellar basal body rod protein FlgB [Rhodobacter capsulatus DE442]ETD78067.1 flagellar basal body rod protein FlgB [Rhodobacter capsulatus B6]ETD80262.1 flagellar basal body rod protein FlgB [Rhodobacter capsulatus R121]ETD82743.1 flagellar basal body rod protein FlgB [Rhodobacter capsulatus YW1]
MFEKLEVFQMSQAMARHAALREGVVATNVANADTPGYRAKDVVSFADSYRTEHAQPMRATRPGHLGANGSYTVSVIEDPAPDSSSPDGNGVSIEDEMVKAVDVKRQHDRALAIYKSSLNVLRASLGRG